MSRNTLSAVSALTLAATLLLLTADACRAAPPPYPFTPPSTHYVTPPSYHPTVTPPLQSYYQQHYYDGTYPHADHYSYYDVKPNVYRSPMGSTTLSSGGTNDFFGPYFPGDYSIAPAEQESARIDREREARVTVHVPGDAEVWFDSYRTTSLGSVRRFSTPPLVRGREYTYEIKVRWQENGRDVTQKQEVPVKAGADLQVTFPIPPAKR
jgi:uncharacterized protein (TIGR03000 family)